MLNGTLIVEARRIPAFYADKQTEFSNKAEAWLNQQIEASQSGKPFAVATLLTPSLAKLLLERNPDNRYVSRKKIVEYVKDIRDGNFELNGETIKISKCGVLNDGQHRCAAVVETGRPIETFIAFGLARSSRSTVDQGKGRTAGDFFKMDGVQDGNVAAAVTNLIYQYLENGRISTHQDFRPTRQQLREFFGRDDEHRIQQSLNFVGRTGLRFLGGRAVIAFCHFVLADTDRDAADYFIGKLIKGDSLASDDPIFRCRERLTHGHRLSVNEKAKLIFSAWSAFRDGRTPSKLVMKGALPKLWGAK